MRAIAIVVLLLAVGCGRAGHIMDTCNATSSTSVPIESVRWHYATVDCHAEIRMEKLDGERCSLEYAPGEMISLEAVSYGEGDE